MKKKASKNFIKNIAEYLIIVMVFICLVWLYPMPARAAECVSIDNVYGRFTDGSLCFQILDKDALTVQVGFGNDAQPSNSSTGLYNKELKEVVIPNTVEYKGKTYSVVKISCYAFYNCTELTSITIGDNVTDMSVGAFKGCSNVSEIVWNARNVNDFAASNELGNGNVFTDVGSETDGISLIFGENVERIPARAFYTNDSNHQYCDKIATVTFGEAITTIGEYAFCHSSALKSVNLPKGLNSISTFCFAGCNSLLDITISDGVKEIGKKAFYNCTAVKELTVGTGITFIANDVFSGCTQLSQINWNVKNMADLASSNGVFSNAGKDVSGISIIFGAEVEHIPANLFFPNVAATKNDYVNITDISFENNRAGEVTIGENAFRGCSGLKSLEIIQNVTSIGKKAFYNCTGLTDLYWNAVRVEDFVCGNGVFENMGSATEGTALHIGKRVQKIPSYAFSPNEVNFGANCKLKNILCEKGATGLEIGNYAFRGCSSMSEYNWDDAVTVIGEYAFYDCTGLKQLFLNHKEKKIGKYAFYGCSQVTLVELGENVQSVGAKAFYGMGKTSGTQVACYNRSSVALVKDIQYNSAYFSVYSPLQIISEHGEYDLKGGSIVQYLDDMYYTAGDTIELKITPDSKEGQAWKIDYVSCNGDILDEQEIKKYTIIMPSCATKLLIVYVERTRPFTAMIGEYGYDSLQEAIEASTENDRIDLMEDVMLSEPLTVDKSVILNGNGNSLRRSKNIRILEVTGGEIYLSDIILDGNEKSGSVVGMTEGELHLKEGSVIKNNISEEENTLLGYGTVYVRGGSLYMEGGQIVRNKAPNGAGIYLAAGTFTMTGGDICNNEALASGGGVYIKNGAVFTLAGGNISNNCCGLAGYGAGVYVGTSRIYVSGASSVALNKKGTVEHNLYLPTADNRLVLTGSTAGANIGITLAVNPSVNISGSTPIYQNKQLTTDNTGHYYEKGTIHADNENYDTSFLSDEVYMVQPVYQITFDSNGGSMKINGKEESEYSITVKRGAMLETAIETLESRGLVLSSADSTLHFVGWYDERERLLVKTEPVTGDIRYYAKWALGICNEPQIDKEEGTYTNPVTVAITADEGDAVYYTLDGTTPDKESLKYEAPITLTEDVVLKAVSMKDNYGASNIVSKSYKIRVVKSVKITDAIKKIFKGETRQLFAEVVTGNQSTSENITWSLVGEDYQEGTKINDEGKLSVAVDEMKEMITICATSAEDETKKDTLIVPVVSGNRIYYHLGYETEEAIKAGEWYETGETVLLIIPERKGYSFGGWSTKETGDDGQIYQPGESLVMGDADIHLYARWIPDAVTVVNIVKMSEPDMAITELTVKNGEKISLGAKVEGTGNFTDDVIWSIDNKTSNDTAIKDGLLTIGLDETSEHITVKATSKFDHSKIASLSVTIDISNYMLNFLKNVENIENGNDYIKGEMSPLFVSKGEEIKIPVCEYTSDNYIFTEWNTLADGSGINYMPGDIYEATQHLTLYAIWKKKDVSPQITDVKIAKADKPEVSVTEDTVVKGEGAKYVATVTGTGEYDNMVIWSLEGSHVEGTTISNSGELTIAEEETAPTIKVVATANGNRAKTAVVTVTIQAARPKEIATINFSHNMENVAGMPTVTGSMTAIELETGTDYVIPECGYSCEGYRFKCWNTEPDASGIEYVAGDKFTVTEDVVLYAVWETISSDAMVTGVSIAKDSASKIPIIEDTVIKGESVNYVAIVTGTGEYDKTVTWRLEGNHADGTNISETGKLTVALEETATTIKVIAIANGDKAKMATIIITIQGSSQQNPDLPPASPDPVSALEVAKKGTTFATENALLRVTNIGTIINGKVEGAEVAYVKPLKNTAKMKVPDAIVQNGVTYKVTSIASNALKKNKKVITVTIGNSIRTIGTSAFAGCVKLKKVTMGSGVTSIGKQAFKDCKKLTSITIGKNVTKIGDRAFEKCIAIKKITIPSKVKQIGKLVFNGDKRLKTITFKTRVLKKVGGKTFKGIHKKAVIKVPKKALKKYKKLLKNKGQRSSVKIK